MGTKVKGEQVRRGRPPLAWKAHKFPLRLPEELFAKASELADRNGRSTNDLLVEAIDVGIARLARRRKASSP